MTNLSWVDDDNIFAPVPGQRHFDTRSLLDCMTMPIPRDPGPHQKVLHEALCREFNAIARIKHIAKHDAEPTGPTELHLKEAHFFEMSANNDKLFRSCPESYFERIEALRFAIARAFQRKQT